MHILHISNDFPNSSLYKQLVLHLDELNVAQTVYSAVRSERETKYHSTGIDHLNINIRNVLYPYDRLLFRLKVRKLFKDIQDQINISNIDLVHAHTLFSDGALAFKIKKKYGIPYVVAIRNTAVNIFQKYRPDLILYKNKILREANKIIFISPAYHNKFLTKLNTNLRKEVEKKIRTIPNGIDRIFLASSKIKEKINSPLKILYVGKFIRRKNIHNLIDAIKILRTRISVKLTLIGGSNHTNSLKIKKLISSNNYSWIEYPGQIGNIEKLRRIYTCHDIFTMVSYNETFGLVYIEALSQGLPIVYTKGEGVDGYFKEGTVAEKVKNIRNPYEIAKKIELLADRLDNDLKERCVKVAQKFNWSLIAKQYKKIYECKNTISDY